MLYNLAILPFKQFFDSLNSSERIVLYILLAAALTLGFLLGKRRHRNRRGYKSFGLWRFPSFQNSGEGLVARVLLGHLPQPDYHLMNHVTLNMDGGTTQIDHILLSRFGVFVIETKDYSGWIFGSESDAKWTSVHFRRKYKFQNPLRQNYKHLLAVRSQLEFVPPEAIKSIVVFSGNAQFKTYVPPSVVHIDELIDFVKAHSVELLSLKRMQYAVGKLETVRLALSKQTDVDHVENLRSRFGRIVDR